MGEPEKFEIVDKAEKLMYHVLDMTTNRKNYPVKYRRVADHLQLFGINLVSYIVSANTIWSSTAESKRRKAELQTQAIAELDKFLLLAKYSLHANLISAATAEKWTALAHDVKYMTIAWRKSCLQA